MLPVDEIMIQFSWLIYPHNQNAEEVNQAGL
jgi:hypothetical protein